MDPGVVSYLEALDPSRRALLERVSRLVLEACPEATVGIAYQMPTYRHGSRRLHVGAFAHGISIYGWKAHGDGGFTARHPEMRTSTGTIRVRERDAADIDDEEFRALARAALGA